MDIYRQEVIDPGGAASKLAHEVCVRSYENSPLVRVIPLQPGNFRGAVGFTWRLDLLDLMGRGIRGNSGGWELIQMVENDGAGGKPQFFTLPGDEDAWFNLGWEIIVMTLDDLARRGAIGAIIDNEVNAERITKRNFRFFNAMMLGYGRALQACGLVNITGETAIMRNQITAFCDDDNDEEQLVVTWGASCIGLLHRSTYVDPAKIEPEMAIVGFKEKGYRCNGGGFFTKLLDHLYKGNVCGCKHGQVACEFVRQLTVPSHSYACFANRLVGWGGGGRLIKPLARIDGIAHITGGGVWEKFREILPEGVGANLYAMPEPPEILRKAQELSVGTPLEIPDIDCYSTFHGGCGMLVVCPMSDWEAIVLEAPKYGIEAQHVGVTVPSDRREVRILSRFREARWLSSDELPQNK